MVDRWETAGHRPDEGIAGARSMPTAGLHPRGAAASDVIGDAWSAPLTSSNLFWAMRRGMAEDEHEDRHRIAGLLALPARHYGRAKRWFLGEEAVVIFHPIRNPGGAPGSAACARAS
jgi:hypothetical protein